MYRIVKPKKMLRIHVFLSALLIIGNLLSLPLKSQLQQNLLACYSMECNGNDGTGNGNHGTFFGNINCVLSYNGTGAVQFGGNSSDFIKLPNTPSMKPTNAITVSGWFKFNSLNGQVLVFSKNTCSTYFDNFSLYFTGSQLQAAIASNCSSHVLATSPFSPFNTFTWYFVVMRIVGGQDISISVNGSAFTTQSHNIPLNYDPNSGIILGGTNQPAANAPFSGLMDNVRIWNRAITHSEVQDLYQNDPACVLGGNIACSVPSTPSGPIGMWLFTGNLQDGVASNHGTWKPSVGGQPTYIHDRCGNANSAIRFNGLNDWIQLQLTGAMPLNGSARSVSFWMRTANTTAGNQSICKAAFAYGVWNGAANSAPPNNTAVTGSRWEICHNYGCQGIGVDISDEFVTAQEPCLNNNVWHHIVVTQAAGAALNQCVLYIDGNQISNPWPNGCSGTSNTGINFTMVLEITIGCVLNVSGNPARFFQGDLDDFYLYNRVLTANDVASLYNCKCPVNIQGPATICGGKTGIYQVTNPAMGGTYNWSIPNGWQLVSGQGTSQIIVQAGTGSGNITVNTGCNSILATLPVSSEDCCEFPPDDFTPLTSLNPVPLPGSYLITQDLTLSSNVTLSNSEFMIAAGKKITVPSGVVLDLDHVHMYSCGVNRWKGIEVLNGGQVITSNSSGYGSSLIEDADIAMDVSGITTGHASAPLKIDQVVFNKNLIGIKISATNQGLTSIPFGITGCVFTSRAFPYSSPGPFNASSWPTADVSSGLRFTSGTNVLSSPYAMMNAVSANILPVSLTPPQVGNVGIQIENVTNVATALPSIGVDIGVSFPGAGASSFNLFDNLGEGIHIENASITTMNNVFQNMRYFQMSAGGFGGTGIFQEITSGMNAGLDLRPAFANQQSTTFGNRFWNCVSGIRTIDVYKVLLTFGTFHSDKLAPLGPAGKGFEGIKLTSNRFHYQVSECEFKNIDDNIHAVLTSGSYDVLGNSGIGTYARTITFNQNVISPEIINGGGGPLEFSSHGITLDGTNASNWNINGACDIWSNTLDDVFRGIKVESTDLYDVEIGGNNIQMKDDNVYFQPQYGIYAISSSGNLKIWQNVAIGTGVLNTQVALIHSARNTGVKVHLNQVSNAYKGFLFEDNHTPSAEWLCNTLITPMKYGISLEQTGAIGNQGSSSMSSGNVYLPCWTPPSEEHTYCDISSSPGSSQLWVDVPTSCPLPGHGGPNPYTNGVDFDWHFKAEYDCAQLGGNYPSPPAFRTRFTTSGESNIKSDKIIQVFPNPTTGLVNIQTSTENELMHLRAIDFTGKVIYDQNVKAAGNKVEFMLPSVNGLYLIELTDGEKNITHLKIVVQD